jgi:hypothetical protein
LVDKSRHDINLDMLIWLSESSLGDWFSEVSLIRGIRDHQCRETVWLSKGLIIKPWKDWQSRFSPRLSQVFQFSRRFTGPRTSQNKNLILPCPSLVPGAPPGLVWQWPTVQPFRKKIVQPQFFWELSPDKIHRRQKGTVEVSLYSWQKQGNHEYFDPVWNVFSKHTDGSIPWIPKQIVVDIGEDFQCQFFTAKLVMEK